MPGFTGIWVPLVTPFHHATIDFPALGSLARRIADAGVAGLVVCGSTGEAAALSNQEQLAVLDAVIQAAPGCPVIMGLSGSNLNAMLAQLAEVQRRDIKGLLISPPPYIRPSQAGIIEYFETLANAAKVPLILYNIPYCTGVEMRLETILSLAQHARIVAIKDCGGDSAMTMQLIADGRLQVLAGEDQQMFATLCLGGAGAIAASAHIRADLFALLARLIAEEKLREAAALFQRLQPLMQLLFEEPNPAPLKALLAQQEWMQEELRATMQAASPELKARLLSALKILNADQPANSATKRCAAALGSPAV